MVFWFHSAAFRLSIFPRRLSSVLFFSVLFNVVVFGWLLPLCFVIQNLFSDCHVLLPIFFWFDAIRIHLMVLLLLLQLGMPFGVVRCAFMLFDYNHTPQKLDGSEQFVNECLATPKDADSEAPNPRGMIWPAVRNHQTQITIFRV
jgi:hypothetical protein